jgi:hypothetical protein
MQPAVNGRRELLLVTAQTATLQRSYQAVSRWAAPRVQAGLIVSEDSGRTGNTPPSGQIPHLKWVMAWQESRLVDERLPFVADYQRALYDMTRLWAWRRLPATRGRCTGGA